MSSWYDFIPIVGGIDDFAEGDIGGGIAGMFPGVGLAYNAYTGAQDELRKGYKGAVAGLREEGDKQRQFQMEGLNRAQSYYQPAAEMAQAAYGPASRLRK